MGYGSRGVVLNTISERKYVLIDERSESEQQKAGLFKNDISFKGSFEFVGDVRAERV
jgi:hypothetical protein